MNSLFNVVLKVHGLKYKAKPQSQKTQQDNGWKNKVYFSFMFWGEYSQLAGHASCSLSRTELLPTRRAILEDTASSAEFKRRVPTGGQDKSPALDTTHTTWACIPLTGTWVTPDGKETEHVVWRAGQTLSWSTSNLCPRSTLEQHKMPMVRKWERQPQVRMMPTLSREGVLTEKETSRFWMQGHGSPLYLHSLN